MAIVEMKRITLLALKQDRGKLLRAMQHMDCVQITKAAKDELADYLEKDHENLDQVDGSLNRLTWAIGQLSRYNPSKPPRFGNKLEVNQARSEAIMGKKDELLGIVDQLEDCERRSGEAKGHFARIQAAMEQLEPWVNLDIPVSQLKKTRDTIQMLGTMPKSSVDALQAMWHSEPAYVTALTTVRETAYVWVVIHRSHWDQNFQALKDGEFVSVQLGDINGTPDQQMKAYANQLAQIQLEQEDIQTEIIGLSAGVEDLKVLYDLINLEQQRLDAESRFAGTNKAFLMHGWVPSDVAEVVAKTLQELSPTCSVEIKTPDDDDEPPTLLHNNRFSTPFESVIEGFSLPAYNGFDPTAIMTPFFACLFGMMVSDAGYGLVLAIGIPLFIKFAKPSKKSQKLMWLLAIGGIFTVFWGFMYNTWFGFSPLHVYFDPINNAIPVMVLCIAVGAVHLFTGLGVAAYINIKRGKPWDAVFDQLSWFMMIVGLGMLLLPQTATIGKYMAIAGLVIILCMAGRAKSKNPIKRLMSGLGSLYGATSWISDLLSYMRLFGMGLATGVIGMVINQLVGMVFSSGIIGMIIGSVLFVGAHLFNAGINILGAYVHSCRLQYIEFFGKFYEEGGKPFRPLGRNTRYANIEEAR